MKILTKLILNLLIIYLIVRPSLSVVKKKKDNIFPSLNLHGEGNIYHLDLSVYFDFSEAKMDSLEITLDPESPGKVGTIKNVYDEHKLIPDLDNSPQQVIQIDKSTFLVAEENKRGIYLIECLEGTNLKSCTSKYIKYNVERDYLFQDARIHESNKFIFLVWLKQDRTQIHVEVVDKDFNAQEIKRYSKPFNAPTDSQTIAKFVNRVKIELLYEDTSRGRRTNLLLFDQFIQNGKDEPIEKKVSILTYNLYTQEKEGYWGELSAANIPHEIYDDNGVIDMNSISTFYSHDDVLYVGSKRTDVNGEKLCLSRLNFDTHIQKLTPGGLNSAICGEFADSSFFGISGRNWIFEVNSAGTMLRKYDLNWPKKNELYNFKLVDRHNFQTEIEGKKIRQIDEGERNFSIHFASDKGNHDAGQNTLTVFTKYRWEFRSKNEEIDIVIDNFNYKIDKDKFYVTLIIPPWYSLDGSLIKPGSSKEIKILAKDSENSKQIEVSSTFTSVTDPMNVIVLENTQHPNIHIGANTIVKHGFEYSDIKQGNSLTFDVEVQKDGKDVDGFNTIHQIITKHEIDFGIEIEKKAPYLFALGTGAAIIVDTDRVKTHFLTCDFENEFKTQCRMSGEIKNYDFVPNKHLDTVGDAIVGYSNYKDDSKSYFSWFNTYDKKWQYELFLEKINDIGHIKVQDSSIWSIIVFQNKIQISKFYDGWVYGNRRTHIFEREDVNAFQFCPVDVILSPYSRNDAYVFSNCPYDKRVFKFTIENNSAYFESSHLINTSKDVDNIDICINYGEIVVFNKDKKELISYDYGFTTTMVKTDLKAFDITHPLNIKCIPEENEFWIVHNKVDEDEDPTDTYAAIFNGGQHKDALNRIKVNFRIGDGSVEHFEYFMHKKRIVFVLFDIENDLKSIGSFDPKKPTLLTEVSYFTKSKEESDINIEFNIVVKNSKQVKKMASKFIYESNIETPENWIRGEKKIVSKGGEVKLNDILKIDEAEISTMRVVDDKGQNLGLVSVSATSDHFVGLDQNGRHAGKYLQLGKYKLVATYTKDNRMRHGEIKMFTTESGSAPHSFYATQSALRSLAGIQFQEDYTFMAFLTDEGPTSELRFIIAYKGMISSYEQVLDNLCYFKSVDLVLKDPNVKLTQSGDEIVNLVLYGYDTKQRVLKAVEITLTLSQTQLEKEESWSVSSKKIFSTTGMFGGVFAIADSKDLKRTNIYYLDKRIKRDNTFFTRVTYNKEKGEFSDAYPVTVDAHHEEETTNIFCNRYQNNDTDECVMSTNGSLVYKAYIPGENPHETSLKASSFMKLRMSGEYIGDKISMGGNYVVLATTPHKDDAIPKLIIWDVSKAEKEVEHEKLNQGVVVKVVPIREIIELTNGVGVDRMNSIFLGAQFYQENQNNEDKQGLRKDIFEIYYQQEFRTSSTYSLFIRSKRVMPWKLVLDKDITSEAFNSGILKIEQPGENKVELKLTDLLTLQTELAEENMSEQLSL